jgi:hypothetical protein
MGFVTHVWCIFLFRTTSNTVQFVRVGHDHRLCLDTTCLHLCHPFSISPSLMPRLDLLMYNIPKPMNLSIGSVRVQTFKLEINFGTELVHHRPSHAFATLASATVASRYIPFLYIWKSEKGESAARLTRISSWDLYVHQNQIAQHWSQMASLPLPDITLEDVRNQLPPDFLCLTASEQ